MTRYFAYGANMDLAAMRSRCPHAHSLGPAVLAGYRFFVGLDGWGSVGPCAGTALHGILWQLTPRDIAALHAFELLHQGPYEVRHVPVRQGRRSLRAMMYVLRRRGRGRPRPGYIEAITAAARQWQLPETYVRTLERLALVGRSSPYAFFTRENL
jgi:hypothetical protein